MDIKIGKRYYWYSTNEIRKRKVVSGLLDSIVNNKAILITKNGDEWKVPIKDLFNKEDIK